jgi:RimJ/RimL family protein N-acetyltransferase
VNLLSPEAGPGALPTITTDRLILRAFEPSDLDALAELTMDAETMRYIAGGEGWTRATGEFLGWNGLQNPRRWMSMVMDCPLPSDTIEVGWTLRPKSLGRGYATEAARAWVAYGFEALTLPEIIAVHDPANVASERVMDRLGMTQRETVELNDGDTLCLHLLGRDTLDGGLQASPGASTAAVSPGSPNSAFHLPSSDAAEAPRTRAIPPGVPSAC